jgi:arylsulfatase A-like enzyme
MVVKPASGSDSPVNKTCETAVLLNDLMPTLLETAGATIPAGVEGYSLTPLLRDPAKTGTSFGREYVHGEHAPAWQFLTDGREKYIWNSVQGEEMFFDLCSDPQELHNLASREEHAQRVRPWREKLIQILSRPARREDGLSNGSQLISGVHAPVVREELLK